MDSRYLPNFTVHHKQERVDTLVRRLAEGLPAQTYKPVNYEQVKTLAAEKRLKGIQQYAKVQKIQNASKENREQNVLNQHKAVWSKEYVRLNGLRKKLQADIDQHICDNTDDDDLFFAYNEYQELDMAQSQNLQEFRRNTADPVHELCEDLKYWVMQYKVKNKEIPGAHPEKVLQQIDSVKNQQAEILNRLRHEEISLQQDLDRLQECPAAADVLHPKRLPRIDLGIPEEAFDLDCPDVDLKVSVLQEFILIDSRYQEKYEELLADHGDAFQLSDTGDWTTDDHAVFDYVLDQYPHGLKDRRKLYLGMLKKLLPKKTRADLVQHEEWFFQSHHLINRQRGLLTDWVRDRRELLNRAKVVFHEACDAAEAAKDKGEEQAKQRELCAQLYARVTDWRDAKMAAMKLEQDLLQQQHEALMEQRRAEEEMTRRVRATQKAKIKEYHTQKETEAEIRLREQQERLEEMKKRLEEQATYDKERVKIREEDYERKLEQKKLKTEEELAAKQEKEEILEALRQKVRPHVESDLMRLWSDTAASKAHTKDENYINIQQPLFGVHSFNSNQLNQDPRLRLESELRKAGLINSDYARDAIAQMKPLHPPRRDMDSTVFK